MAVPVQFAYRTLKGIGITDAAPVYEPLPGFQKPEGNSRCCTYSPCGRYFAWASVEGVTVVDASVGHVITTLPTPNVYELGFSPRGSYIITWERPSKDEAGDAVKNLNPRMPVLLAPQEYERWLTCGIADVIGFQFRKFPPELLTTNRTDDYWVPRIPKARSQVSLF